MVLGGCPVFATAYMGRKRRTQPFQRFCYEDKRLPPSTKSLCSGVKASEKFIFGPGTWCERGAPVQRRGSSFDPTSCCGRTRSRLHLLNDGPDPTEGCSGLHRDHFLPSLRELASPVILPGIG